jgi:serine/threonine-protein kinase HipA
VTEYVLRDLLNQALGNPDNHGRNTALQKLPDGTIRLTPLFDFCPMKLDPTGIRRSTTWACMRPPGQIGRDLDPDWSTVCAVAAAGVMEPSDLRARIAAKASILADMPSLALAFGIPREIVDRAMSRCSDFARAVAAIATET